MRLLLNIGMLTLLIMSCHSKPQSIEDFEEAAEIEHDDSIDFDEEAPNDEIIEREYFDNEGFKRNLEWQAEYLNSEKIEGIQISEKEWEKEAQKYRFNEEEEKEKEETPIEFKEQKKSKPFKFKLFSQKFLKILLYILVIGAIAILIYYLIKQYYKSANRQNERDVVKSYQLKNLNEDQLKALDTLKLIAKAEAQGDYKNAYRLRYLHLIKLLVLHKKISFKKEFTNHNYIAQLRHSEYVKDFATLTNYFDYYWYGDISISNERYLELKPVFDTFYNKISKEAGK
jgi:hypothetical protein